MKHESDQVAFLDLLFNIAFLFTVLFVLTTFFINPVVHSQKNIEAKAEAIITITWPNEFNDDVDSYLEDPTGAVVWFQDKEQNLMHLDRDDRGSSYDTVITEYGTFSYPENKEVLTIRGWIDGEYTLWIHMFNKLNTSGSTPVNIQLEKINPSVKLLMQKDLLLSMNGESKTVFRFTVKDGKIESFNDLPKEFPPKNKKNSIYGADSQ